MGNLSAVDNGNRSGLEEQISGQEKGLVGSFFVLIPLSLGNRLLGKKKISG